jgi:hypothetical protein
MNEFIGKCLSMSVFQNLKIDPRSPSGIPRTPILVESSEDSSTSTPLNPASTKVSRLATLRDSGTPTGPKRKMEDFYSKISDEVNEASAKENDAKLEIEPAAAEKILNLDDETQEDKSLRPALVSIDPNNTVNI